MRWAIPIHQRIFTLEELKMQNIAKLSKIVGLGKNSIGEIKRLFDQYSIQFNEYVHISLPHTYDKEKIFISKGVKLFNAYNSSSKDSTNSTLLGQKQ